MSHTLDLLTDSDTHGTPDGYRAGCKTNHCPSPVPCHTVYLRYVGDWGFARRVDAGESAVDIIAAEVADAAARAERDRVAERAEKRRLHAEHVAREARKTERKPRKPRPVKEPRPTIADTHGAEIRRMHGEGANDSRIAGALGLSINTVRYVRAVVFGLPAAAVSIGGIPASRFDELTALHGEGLNDLQISVRMNVDRGAVWRVRKKLGLPLIPAPKGTHTPPAESSHLAAVRAAHAEGLTDAEIGARVGISKAWANALRRRLGLQANTKKPTRSFVEQPHGVFARYRSGCRCPECREANAAMSRKYREAS